MMKWIVACVAVTFLGVGMPAFAVEPEKVAEKVNEVIVDHLSKFNQRCLYDYRLDPKSLKAANISALIKVIYRDGSDKSLFSSDTELNKLKSYIKPYDGENGETFYFVGDLENKALYRDLSEIKDNFTKKHPDLTTPGQFFSHIKDSKQAKDNEKDKKFTDTTLTSIVSVPYEMYAENKMGQTSSLYITNDCNKAANVSLKSKMNISIPFVEMKYLLDSLYDNQNNRKIEIFGFDFSSKASELGIVRGVLPPAPDKVDMSAYLALWNYYTSSEPKAPVVAKSMRGIYIVEYVASEGDAQLDINLKSGVYYGDHRAGMGGASLLKGKNRYKVENQYLYFMKSEADKDAKREQFIDELPLISVEVLKDRLENAIVSHEAETNKMDQKLGVVELDSNEKEIVRTYGLAGIPDQYCSKEFFQLETNPPGFFADSRFRISRDDKRFGCLVVARLSGKDLASKVTGEKKYVVKLKSTNPGKAAPNNEYWLEITLGSVIVKSSSTAVAKN